ncbi:MAG TPA: hypothetical protein VHZ73_12660 [Vicinamibacterales bacterium]|nr:hypothetical protein [Vicinamibacterales bacterium]
MAETGTTVEIRPPSVRRETLIVGQLAIVIVAAVAFYLANTAWSSSGGQTRVSDLMPYQALVRDRPSTDQRMFRELQEGLLEAERVRSTSGGWPAPAALAEQSIPPFAADPTRPERYVWTATQHGAFVDYLGTPQVTGVPAWLLLVQEPDKGAPPDPAKEDEEHHRLTDGTMLHVSVWTHADGTDLPAHFVSLPQVEGWTQLRAGPPVKP